MDGIRIGFIGLGNMGLGMAANLVRAGHEVHGHDLKEEALAAFEAAGGRPARSVRAAVQDAAAVVTVLRSAQDVRAVYGGQDGILQAVAPAALLIECSTIGPAAAREAIGRAAAAGMRMLDAPVAGGQAGAREGRLTFMVGGDRATFEAAEPLLQAMGTKVLHAGGAGNGQIAKLCNNLIACVSSAVVSEAFLIGQRLGMDAHTLYDIVGQSTGQCWTLTHNCPVPGPLPGSPASRDYAPSFTAELMLKDMLLVADAAASTGAASPFGALAVSLYRQLLDTGHGARDWTVLTRLLEQMHTDPVPSAS